MKWGRIQRRERRRNNRKGECCLTYITPAAHTKSQSRPSAHPTTHQGSLLDPRGTSQTQEGPAPFINKNYTSRVNEEPNTQKMGAS